MTTILELRHLSRAFGALRAVDDLTLTVRAGARHAVIGANGAGKSTLFALIDGSQKPTAGTIALDGRDITRWPQYRRARAGMARVFQQPTVATRLTARENVLLGLHRAAGAGWAPWLPPGRRRALVAEAGEALAAVGLAGLAERAAGQLSHGQRRQLELAVALSTRPRLLLLDEPAAGLSAAEAEELAEHVAKLPRDVTVLLVEHDLDIVVTVADTVTVLHRGRHLVTGAPEQVRADPAVRASYLGRDDPDGGTPVPAGPPAAAGTGADGAPAAPDGGTRRTEPAPDGGTRGVEVAAGRVSGQAIRPCPNGRAAAGDGATADAAPEPGHDGVAAQQPAAGAGGSR